MTESSLAAMLEAEVERDRQARFSEIGAESLAWLAFPPVWTDRLARVCGFPDRTLPFEELLDRAEVAGWCVRQETEVRSRTPALRLHLLVQLGELSTADPEVLLLEIQAEADETLRAQLLARLATTAEPEAVPSIHAAARGLTDPAAAADVMLAIATRDGEHAESVRLYLRGLLDQITDPAARLVRLLRFRELTIVPAQAWRREFLDFFAALQDQNPVLAARLLKEATAWLPAEDVSSLVDRVIGTAPVVARGDLAEVAALAGRLAQALDVAASIDDERIRLHTYAQLLGPFSRAGSPLELAEVKDRCASALPLLDAVAEATVVEGSAGAGLTEDAEGLAVDLLHTARDLNPTPALVGALQRAADALMSARAGGSGLTLVRRSAELAGQLANPIDRAAGLSGAIRLARRHGLPYPLDTTPVVRAARGVYDDEDRARALAQAALLVGGSEGANLAQEALALAARLDEGAVVATAWVPDGARAEILEELRRQLGFTTIQEITVRIGRRVSDARRRGELVPEAMARWAELAGAAGERRENALRAPAVLDERVAQLLAAGATGQAFAWLDTARSLAPLLLGAFETSVVANTRKVELAHRRELDRRRLAEFLPREGQLRAFEALLTQADQGPWALHYLGVGGVGKTTLVRHLTARLAPERDVVTSRIDFDHINPDFPRRRPAQLLLELATELEPHAQERRQMTLFRQAYEQLQEINAAALPGTPPITVADSRFARAVRTFGGFLQTLERPVVLILDTCEELEKFTPVGGRIEQLEAAFALIEALHAAVPRLRVVLAGRRPLARAGHDWRLPVASGEQEPDALLPERKPYLVVHEIRGFDRAETEEFLRRIKRLAVAPELLEAILARSPDTETAVVMERPVVEWPAGLYANGKHVADPQERWQERPPVDGPRYNPFDLEHYANWLRAEPSLTASDITWTDRDTYVESRIIGRLNHADVERLLPAVAALGRFDRGVLRPAFDGDEQAFANAWRELAATEWVDIQFDAALDTTFLEVDRRLRPRLESYYKRSENRGLRAEASRRLGPGLARLCDERPLDRLGVDHVAAALRLLPAEETARLVDRLALKVIEEAAWGWAERVVERVLADQPDLGRPEHPAAAGLWATLASALTHLDPERHLDDLWASVEDAARARPHEELSGWLVTRAALAQGEVIGSPRLAKAATSSEDLQEWVLEALADEGDQRRRQVLLGGLLTAVERRLDEAEAAGNRIRLLDPGDLESPVLAEPPAVRAYIRMLTARVLLLDARFGEAERAFADAAALATDPGTPPAPWLTADWLPPEDLPRRIWLEALRAPIKDIGRPEVGSPPIPNDHLGGIDADRLASAALRRRLGRGVVPAEELAVYERIDDLLETRRPVCEAHRAVPPFFVTVAYGWLVLGEFERAQALLTRGERSAIASRDHWTSRAIITAERDLARRLRLEPATRAPGGRVQDSGEQPAQGAVRDAGPFQDQVSEHPTYQGWEEAARLQCQRTAWARTVHEIRPVVQPFLPVIGPRRVAELLLEEGESLASRQPGPATTPIGLAITLFEETGDSFGVFAATVMADLVRFHAGWQASQDAASRLRRAYEGLRRGRADGLPEWGELMAVVDASSGPRPLPLPSGPWEGWLLRMLLVMAWAARLEALPRVRAALEEADSRSGDRANSAWFPDKGDVPPPPLLQGSPAAPGQAGAPPNLEASPPGERIPRLRGTAPGDPAGAPPERGVRYPLGPESFSEPDKRGRRRRLVLTTVAAAIVVAAVALVTWFLAAEPLAPQPSPPTGGGEPNTGSPDPAGPLWWVLAGVVAAVVVVGAGAGFLLWRRLRAQRRRAALSYGTLSIDAIAAEGENLLFTPYEQQRGGLPERVRRAAPRAATANGLGISVLSSDLAELPWEAQVLLGLGDVQAPCWREHASGSWPPPRWWEFRRVRRSVLVSDTWAALVQETLGWAGAREATFPLPPKGEPPRNHVLVLIGTPVETSAGIRLQVASMAAETTARDLLVGHDSVPYPRFGLVVVVGEPAGGLIRVDAEREQTSKLRRFAADVVDAGAPSVLCLPAMPEDLARQVLNLLDRRLRRIRRRGWREIVATTSRIRGTIAAAGTTDEERAAAKELALEVTVWPA